MGFNVTPRYLIVHFPGFRFAHPGYYTTIQATLANNLIGNYMAKNTATMTIFDTVHTAWHKTKRAKSTIWIAAGLFILITVGFWLLAGAVADWISLPLAFGIS